MKGFVVMFALLYFFTCSNAQYFVARPVVFAKTQYYKGADGNLTYDTIYAAHEKIDIPFYKQHFNCSYHLPETFTDTRFKDTTISVWNNDDLKKDFQNHWLYAYTYNGLSQLVNYSYSGCIICNNMAYNYSVQYDKEGRVQSITSNLNGNDRFRFYYNSKNEVSEVDCYAGTTITTQIVMLK